MENLNCKEETNAAFSVQINPKNLRYILGIRMWYLACPMVALILGYYDLAFALRIFEIAIAVFSAVCISSQFFSSASWGIDMEQYNLHKESEIKAKKHWGIFYASPILWCLPCILVIAVIEIPTLINFIFAR